MPAGPLPDIPNTGQRTVRANMKVKSFVSPENPSQVEISEYDKEIDAFLKTIDNQKRFLNGRNSYSVGNRVYTLIWYLERIPEAPITQPFGDKIKPAKPTIESEKKDSSPEEKKSE